MSQEELAYPTFDILTDQNEPSMDYFTGWETGYLVPSRNWCYLATITQEKFHIMRPSVIVEDAKGRQHLIVFHLDNHIDTRELERSFVKGHTVASLYAQRKTFLDLSEGIRLEDTEHFKVFKCSRAVLEKELKKVNNQQSCFYCGKEKSKENRLSACGKCHLAVYCGRDCQLAHWNEVHKALCPDMKYAAGLDKLMKAPFTQYKKFSDLV